MATAQRRKKREVFLDANGAPMPGAYLQYFQAGTTTALTTYSDAAGTIPNSTVTIPSRPDLGALIQLDASGFTQEPVYLQDVYAAKEVLLSNSLSVVSTEDNIPAGLASFTPSSFAFPQTPWLSLSASTALGTGNFGDAFACTPGSGTLTVTLPNAVGNNGQSILFKKLGVTGTLAWATTLGQVIDGLSAYSVSSELEITELQSDGANWRVTSNRGAAPGFITATRSLLTPSGWLYCNGQAVARTLYPALDNAIYCGDSNNATALDCYHCDNPASPNTTQDTNGAYLVLPDLRGEFFRGFDDGRGVDSGRTFWSWQNHQFQDHSHQLTTYQNSSTSLPGPGPGKDSSNSVSTGTANSGNHGSETRPRNLALRYLIKT
jgi:microcystin-dependent protein